MPAVTRSRAVSPAALFAALLSAIVLFAAMAVTAPTSAMAATELAANCSANLRTSASLSGVRKVTISTDTRVTHVRTVEGSSWKATCAGKAVSGSKWHRISAINGRSVQSLYGVTYLYAATGLFRIATATASPVAPAATETMAAQCGTNLRSSASTSARIRTTIGTGTKVTVVAKVSGSSWKTTCAGKSVSGSTWYRISAINGTSVKARFGVSYLYAASGLLAAVRAPAPAPAPAPVTLYAACNDVNVRTTAATTGDRPAILAAGTAVTVDATVAGSAWSANCAGKDVSGSQWHRITAVGGQSVTSLYGVAHVFGAAGLFSASAPPPDTGTDPLAITEGIDVSHWNGTIDWAKVRSANKRFAFLKASENIGFVDSTYASNRAAAKAAGLLVGAYHFARPETTAGDAVAEADHFIATAKFAKGDLLPVLDLEVTGGLGPAALESWTKSFLTRLYERTGLRAIVYTSPAFWKASVANSTWFADNGYKVLWIAHWTTAEVASVPAADWGGEGWTFWQYSSTGTVPGISGRVDLNRYRGSDFTPVLVP